MSSWLHFFCHSVANMGLSASSDASPSEGKKFHDTYEMAEELGSGGYSTVWLGVHKKTGEEVAVKVVEKEDMPKDQILALQMEVEIVSELDHPHVVSIKEVFDEEEIYIVQELVNGGELFDRIVTKVPSHCTDMEPRPWSLEGAQHS